MPEPGGAGLISVVGGESTGKSTLAAALGVSLPAVVVGEHLRTWVDRHGGRVPSAVEQAAVAAAQRESEIAARVTAAGRGLNWVVSDSGPLMTAVYSIQYYGDDSLLPTALDAVADGDLVVWCQDDFPWQPDPQRDGVAARAESQRILAGIFDRHPGLPVLPVRGPLVERVEVVVDSVAAQQDSPRPG